MSGHGASLRWVESQASRMRSLVIEWAEISSGSHNLAGLSRLTARLRESFSVLGGGAALIELPPYQVVDSRGNINSLALGKALSIRKRPSASRRIFLGIHMDTVYGPDDPFQRVEQIDQNTLRGPGVADAKGGLAVMLIAIEALERSELADRIGWEVLINPDEELGSPGSAELLVECARRNHLGLVFEPAFPDGSLVAERKGSGNFTAVIHGRAAHAGRDFAAGRNAIHAAAQFVVEAYRINGAMPGVTLNVGKIDGGGPVNVVPDLAVVRLNARVTRAEDQYRVEEELDRIAADVSGRNEVSVQMHGGFLSAPKILDQPTRELCDRVSECGRELGLSLEWRSSGGVSDGNKLAAAGLPVVDTMGPRGGNLHSPQEFVLLDSIAERAKLTCLLLLKLAAGEIEWPANRALAG